MKEEGGNIKVRRGKKGRERGNKDIRCKPRG